MASAVDPYSAFHDLSDAEWHELLLASVSDPTVNGVAFPGFPAEATQELFTSFKNEEAIREALVFYDIVRRAGADYGRGWDRRTTLLDFGVGWGRIARTFLKDVAPENLLGIDVNPDILAECRQLMPYGNYQQCHIGQPLPVERASIDVVIAFSVFSHLSEDNHLHWIREFHRVLKPGGVAVLTTLSRDFLRQCDAAISTATPSWVEVQVRDLVADRRVRGLGASFGDFPTDEYFYLPTGGGLPGTDADDYGWAIVPLGYAQRAWSPYFEICESASPMAPLVQAVFIVRKRNRVQRLVAALRRARAQRH